MLEHLRQFMFLRCFFVAAAFSFHPRQDETVSKAPSLTEMHIAVHVVDSYGNPTGFLSAADFHITANGSPLPFKISRPSPAGGTKFPVLPTRLLVLLSPAEGTVGSHQMMRLADHIKPFWVNNWQISVLDAFGTQTPYVSTDSDFRKALSSGTNSTTTVFKSLNDLGHFTGRRVVFVVTGPRYAVDASTSAAALHAGAMVYHIGGVPVSLSSVGSEPASEFMDFSSNGEVIASAVIPGAPSSYSVRTNLNEERTFSAAQHDALFDGLGFYDLCVTAPDDTPSIHLTMSVPGIRKTTYRARAQLYARGTPLPRLTLEQSK